MDELGGVALNLCKMNTASETKCNCQHCSGHIAFPTEMAGQTVECPHCKLETTLFIPQTPKSLPTIQGSSSSYIHKNLMPGEVVIGTTVMHWAIYLPALFTGIIILILFFISVVVEHGITIQCMGVFSWFILVTIPLAISAFINRKTSEFAVTNKRVLMKCGFIRRKSIEIILSKVESIKVDQGILGRILDYGTIIVCGTGGTKDPFHKIASPLKFRQMIQMEIEKIGDRK